MATSNRSIKADLNGPGPCANKNFKYSLFVARCRVLANSAICTALIRPYSRAHGILLRACSDSVIGETVNKG